MHDDRSTADLTLRREHFLTALDRFAIFVRGTAGRRVAIRKGIVVGLFALGGYALVGAPWTGYAMWRSGGTLAGMVRAERFAEIGLPLAAAVALAVAAYFWIVIKVKSAALLRTARADMDEQVGDRTYEVRLWWDAEQIGWESGEESTSFPLKDLVGWEDGDPLILIYNEQAAFLPVPAGQLNSGRLDDLRQRLRHAGVKQSWQIPKPQPPEE